MRFAIVDGQRKEANPKLAGVCGNCGGTVIAKCGRVKVWHWAHKGRPPCDPWWESETDWHRNWKNKFPTEWQEISHVDQQTSERHIADVKNPFGLVIEFQHSPIAPGEMRSREQFYGKMIWIVDGARSDFDATYFKMGISGPIQDNPLAYQINWVGRGRLLHNWGEAQAKVYLDFGDEWLWRLVFFDPARKVGAVGPIPRGSLIEDCLQGTEVRVAYK